MTDDSERKVVDAKILRPLEDPDTITCEITVKMPGSSADWVDWRSALAVEFTDVLKGFLEHAEQRLTLKEQGGDVDPEIGKRRGRK